MTSSAGGMLREAAARHGLRTGALAACVLLGCGHAPEPPARHAAEPTTLAKPRPFVAPYSYEYFMLAELLAARGRWAEAAEAYRTALSGGDDDAYLLARLAEALDHAGDAGGADAALEEALRLDPAADEAWMTRGRIAERRGELEVALGAYEKAEAAAPDAPGPVLASARLLRAAGHDERAVAVLERYAARSGVAAPDAARARLELALARADGPAIDAAVQALLALAAPERRALLDAAAVLLARGYPTAAARVLVPLPASPQRDRLYLEALLGAGSYARAELLLLETREGGLRTPERLADVYLAMGQPERALATLDTATDDPTPERRRLRAEALAALGRQGEAAALFVEIPAKSRQFPASREDLAQLLEASGRPALAAEVRAAAKER